MRYLSIGWSECDTFVTEHIAGQDPRPPEATPQGVGTEVDWKRIRSSVQPMTEIMEAASKDLDQAEGRCAIKLHRALDGVEAEVLDDPGFWRYLALHYFFDLIKRRQPDAFHEPKSANTALRYVNARTPTYAVLTRMYLRAVALGPDATSERTDVLADETNDESAHLAHVVPEATDFWQSHIIRVRTRTAPPLVRALVRRQRDDRLTTKPLRMFAKDAVNRTWSNVVLTEYDDDEAAELLDELAVLVGVAPRGNSGDSSDRQTP